MYTFIRETERGARPGSRHYVRLLFTDVDANSERTEFIEFATAPTEQEVANAAAAICENLNTPIEASDETPIP
jgi:hypothetical protein